MDMNFLIKSRRIRYLKAILGVMESHFTVVSSFHCVVFLDICQFKKE